MHVQLLLVPYDAGRRDWRMGRGPEHLLRHGAGSVLRTLGHDVSAETVDAPEVPGNEAGGEFALHARLAGRVQAAVSHERLPVVLSGRCGGAIGILGGLDREDGHTTGVVWLDAHGDFNTPETTRSGMLDGMCLATITGRCWRTLASTVPGFRPVPAEHVVLVGARDLDDGEAVLLAASGVERVSPEAVRSQGVDAALGPALDALRARVSRVYLHVDLDVLDVAEGRANAFAGAGGLTRGELRDVVRLVAQCTPLAAAALASYDPACDEHGTVWEAAIGALEAIVSAPGAP